MLRPAGDMDFDALEPHRATRVGPVADEMRRSKQRQLRTIDERPARRQAFQPGGNPAGLLMGEFDRNSA